MYLYRGFSICILVVISCYLSTVYCAQENLETWRRNPKYDLIRRTNDEENPRKILRPFMENFTNLNATLNQRHIMKMKHRSQLRNQLNDPEAVKQLERFLLNRMPKYAQTQRSYRRKLMGYRPTTKQQNKYTKKLDNESKKGRQGEEPPPGEETPAPNQPAPEGDPAPQPAEGGDATAAEGETTAAALLGTTLPVYYSPPKENIPEFLRPFKLRSQLETMVADFPDVNMTIETLGQTVSFNEILLIKATAAQTKQDASLRSQSKYIDEAPEKKIIFIVHALTLVDVKLIDCLSTVPGLKDILKYYFEHLDKYDIFIIPLANPDGFAEHSNVIRYFSDSTVPLFGPIWEKNMSKQKGSCVGVNLDRNFDVGWNGSTNTEPCRQDYQGPRPFSEVETQVIRQIFHRHSQRMGAYIHVHGGAYAQYSYRGDAVLYPKGYTDVTSEDDKYMDLKGEIEETLKLAGFKTLTVTVDTLYNWYGKVTGTSVDYAATVYGIPYAMEFAIQSYSVYKYNNFTLREVWHRVINITFININKIRTEDLFEKK